MTEDLALHARLKQVVGDRPYQAIASLTGHHVETTRRYLTSQVPSVDFIAALCDKLAINADWLLTGAGPMRLADLPGHSLSTSEPKDLITAVAESIERLMARVDRLEQAVRALETAQRPAPRNRSNAGRAMRASQRGVDSQDENGKRTTASQNTRGIVEPKGRVGSAPNTKAARGKAKSPPREGQPGPAAKRSSGKSGR